MSLDPRYKQVRLKTEIHTAIVKLAGELAIERGRPKEDLQNVVAEAIKFYQDNRKKAK